MIARIFKLFALKRLIDGFRGRGRRRD